VNVKNKKEKRSKFVPVVFRPSEVEELDRICEYEDVPRSSFIRRVVMHTVRSMDVTSRRPLRLQERDAKLLMKEGI
jgi:hypothetical protein